MRTRPAISSVAALVSLALCVAANPAAAVQTLIAGREGPLTLTTRAPTGQRGHWFVEFQEEIGEAADPSRAGAGGKGGRSLRGAADVDCAASQFKVAKFSVFAGPTFTGAVLLDVSNGAEWRSPERGTTMDRVLVAACGKTKVRAPGRAAGVSRPDPNPPTQPSAPSAPPARAAAAEAVAPSIVSSAAGPIFYAQLASLPSADAARQAWEALKGAAPGILDDRLRRLTMAKVHGRRFYRVSTGGFGTKAQAEMVCKAMAHLSARCFVRPGDTTDAAAWLPQLTAATSEPPPGR